MKILLTGPFGNVGLSTLNQLIKRGYIIRAFDIKNKKNRKIAKKFKYSNQIEILWGDISNSEDVEKAIKDIDVIIHLAAIIPPLADKLPELAEEINVGGTANIIKAIKNQNDKPNPKLIFTSSIAVYGDRRNNPMITLADPLNPSKGDYYAITKIKAENIIRESSIKHFLIFRLTYITSVNKLEMDPLMFHMPLDTCIEICDTKDVGLALVNAIECKEIWNSKEWGNIFHIAGGEQCRTMYKKYINNMMEIFGLGRDFLPEQAFEQNDFHCGFMDTAKSQNLLKYQMYTLENYYDEVRKKVRVKRFFMPLVKWAVRLKLLRRSEAYKRYKFFRKKIGAFSVSENKLIRKILYKNFKKIDMLEQKVYDLEKVIQFLTEKNEYPDLFQQEEQY